MNEQVILVQRTDTSETVWLYVENYGKKGYEEKSYVSSVLEATHLSDSTDAQDYANMINEAGNPTFGRVVTLSKEEWKRLTEVW